MLTLLEENVQSVHILTGCLWCVGKRGWGGGGRGRLQVKWNVQYVRRTFSLFNN